MPLGEELWFQPCLHIWKTHWWLCTPELRGGSQWAENMLRKKFLWPSIHVPLNSVALLLWWAQASSMYTPRCGHTTLRPLQAVYMQPTPVLSLGLSSKGQVLVPRACLYQQTCVSGWRVHRSSVQISFSSTYLKPVVVLFFDTAHWWVPLRVKERFLFTTSS